MRTSTMLPGKSYLPHGLLFLALSIGCHQNHDGPGEGANSTQLTSDVGAADSELRSAVPMRAVVDAQIATTIADIREIRKSVRLPGRFAYDARNFVSVRLATDGVVEEVLVRPGEQVQANQPLALMHCPEIGTARSRLIQNGNLVALAERESQWHTALRQGVETAARMISEGRQLSDVERTCHELTLGEYQQTLIAAYSDFIRTSQLSSASIQQLDAVSGRLKAERLSDSQRARATLKAALEESQFESTQLAEEAALKLEAAKRDLTLARQDLTSLLGSSETLERTELIASGDQELSKFFLTAPRSGTIESVDCVAGERIQSDSQVFAIADPKRLWVEADVRESTWEVMQLAIGSQVEIEVPALPDYPLQGAVYFQGRSMEPATGSLSLVVEVLDEHGFYRPGLFARVQASVGPSREALVVPRSALFDIEGKSHVFVVEDDSYRARAIRIGGDDANVVEVLEGLERGEEVVAEGVFLLKSELLLEGEE